MLLLVWIRPFRDGKTRLRLVGGQAAWTAAREFGAAKKGADVFFLILPNEEFALVSLERIADLTRSQMACAMLNLSKAIAELGRLLAVDDGTRAASSAKSRR